MKKVVLISSRIAGWLRISALWALTGLMAMPPMASLRADDCCGGDASKKITVTYIAEVSRETPYTWKLVCTLPDGTVKHYGGPGPSQPCNPEPNADPVLATRADIVVEEGTTYVLTITPGAPKLCGYTDGASVTLSWGCDGTDSVDFKLPQNDGDGTSAGTFDATEGSGAYGEGECSLGSARVRWSLGKDRFGNKYPDLVYDISVLSDHTVYHPSKLRLPPEPFNRLTERHSFAGGAPDQYFETIEPGVKSLEVAAMIVNARQQQLNSEFVDWHWDQFTQPVEIVRDNDGQVKELRCDSGTVFIHTLADGYGFSVVFRDKAGLIVSSWRIENPNATDLQIGPNTVPPVNVSILATHLVKAEGSDDPANEATLFEYQGNSSWSMQDIVAGTVSTKTQAVEGDNNVVTIERHAVAGGATIERYVEARGKTDGKLAYSIEGIAGEELRTDYNYDAVTGRALSLSRTDGYYEVYQTLAGDETAGVHTVQTLQPWLDVPMASATGANVKATVRERVRHPGGGETVTSVEKIAGQNVSRTITSSWKDNARPIAYVSTRQQAAGGPESYSLNATYHEGAAAHLRGRPVEQFGADGRQVRYFYELKPLAEELNWINETEDLLHIEEITGMGDGPAPLEIPSRSTKRVTVLGTHGQPIIEEEHVCGTGGSYELLRRVRHSYSKGKLVKSERSTGQGAWQVMYDAGFYASGRTQWEKDETGVKITFSSYDSQGRARLEMRESFAGGNGLPAVPAQSTERSWDSAGRLVMEKLSSAGVVLQVHTWEYDSRGRLINESTGPEAAEQRLVTSTLYNWPFETVTLPGGSTRITEHYMDGQVKQVSGTATVSEKHSYSLAGSLIRKKVTRGDATRYMDFVSEHDGSGNTVREKVPTTSESWRSFLYDSAGRRLEEKLNGTLIRSWQYPEMGKVVQTQRQGDPEPDRVTTVLTEFRKEAGGDWWRVIDQGQGREQRERVSSLTPGALSEAILKDENGVISTNSTVDRATGIVTTVSQLPGVGNVITTKSYAGLTLWQLGPQSNVSSHAATTRYDGLGRAVEVIDGATGIHTSYGYDPVTGQVGLEQTWGGAATYASAAATSRTSTVFSYYGKNEASPGRLKSQTKDGQVTSFTYTPRGELAATWGASYPLKYEYDAAGRLWKMRTYRSEPGNNPSQWPAGDLTEWVYHAGTPLLQRKKDANGSGALLLYDPAGRLQKRTWVRNVSATYSYNLADDLRGIDYSDTTPDVTFTRDNQGRLATLNDGAGQRSYDYESGRLVAERHANGRGLFYGYDAAGRKAGYSLWSPSGWLTWGGWGYEPATGRVSGVSTAAGWVGYGYAAGGRTVQTTTFGAAATTRTPDALGRIKTMETKVGTVLPSPLFKHTYVYDAQGRREKATQGNSNWWSYTYNDRNEVMGGYKKWPNNASVAGFQGSYYYDAIGNRTLTFPNTTQASWTPNSLNQITSKAYSAGNVPEVTVTGEANSAATVKVNGTTAARNGTFFSRAVSGSGAGEALWAKITVEETVGTTVTASDGWTWIDPLVESFSYDLDGNLTQDGRWTYTWDGENRLIKMETRTSGVPTTLPKDKLVFRYDSHGRRTEKEFWRKNSSDVYQLQYQSYFTYEGWNLIAEEIASPSSANVPELRRSFHWGVDLSGSLQGAGGVGGLLLMHDHASGGMDALRLGGPTTSFFYTYDGNGNVMGLLNVSDPQAPRVEAEYEYGAFGEPLRATGIVAAVNPFRFSTKYQDQETGLYYYGYRYYSYTLGKWLSRDPLGEVAGASMYAMVKNDPVRSVDVLGLLKRSDVVKGTLRYSCNCGWIDESHRGTGAMYRTITGAMNEYESGGSAILQLGQVGWNARYRLTYAGLLSGQPRMETALAIFLHFQGGFEGSPASTAVSPFTGSSFSVEDLPTDYLAFMIVAGEISDFTSVCEMLDKEDSLRMYDFGTGPKTNRSYKPALWRYTGVSAWTGGSGNHHVQTADPKIREGCPCSSSDKRPPEIFKKYNPTNGRGNFSVDQQGTNWMELLQLVF